METVQHAPKRSRSPDSLPSRSAQPSPLPGKSTEDLIQVPLPHFLRQSTAEINSKFNHIQLQGRQRFNEGRTPNPEKPSRWDRVPMTRSVLLKNRYTDIFPWAGSRIRLSCAEGECDYINASPISLRSTKSGQETRYIASQGPKANGVSGFWHMMWNETCPTGGVVVMLTTLAEDGREKCHQYYPDVTEATYPPQSFGDSDPMFSSPAEAMEIETSTETHPSTPNTSTTHIINIPSVLQDTPQPTQDAPMNSGTQEMPDASSAAATQEPSTQAEEATSEPSPPSTALHFTSDFTPTGRITMVSKSYHDSSQSTLREFTLQHGEAQKTIWHISFLAWPDHSVPKTLESRNELMNLIRFARQKNNDVFTTPSPTAEDSVLSTETESPSASSPVIATANQNPIVVHCSAGCGRTGTYMALEHLLSELHEGSLPERDSPQPSPSPDTVPNTNPHIPSTTVQTANQDGIKSPAKSHPDPINATVQTLRDQRMIMVQTSDQFQLLYTMIKTEFIKRRQALHEAAKEEQKRCELEAEENRRKAALSDAVASSASTHASTEKKINGKGEPLAKAQKRGLGFRNALLRTISGRKAPVVDESSKATPAQNGGGSQELPTSTSSQRSVPEGEGSGSDSAIPSSITDAGTAAPDTTKVASV